MRVRHLSPTCIRPRTTGTMPNSTTISVRCPFCGTLNHIDIGRAADRPQCGECNKPVLLDRPMKVAQDDFDRTVLQASAPVLVDFYADWCAPCKMVAPFVDELANEFLGKLLVVKVDTDSAPDVAMKYEIRSIPTLIIFNEGAEVDRSLGLEPERVRGLIQGLLA